MKQLIPASLLIAALTLAPLDAAVRPPRMEYSIATLPNGMTVVLSEDHIFCFRFIRVRKTIIGLSGACQHQGATAARSFFKMGRQVTV